MVEYSLLVTRRAVFLVGYTAFLCQFFAETEQERPHVGAHNLVEQTHVLPSEQSVRILPEVHQPVAAVDEKGLVHVDGLVPDVYLFAQQRFQHLVRDEQDAADHIVAGCHRTGHLVGGYQQQLSAVDSDVPSVGQTDIHASFPTMEHGIITRLCQKGGTEVS